MRPQRFEFGDREWPEGKGVLQVYAPINLARNPELADLIRCCRDAVRGAPVAVVEDRFLHVTIDVVADTTSDQISGAEREELHHALRQRLAHLPAYRGEAGSALAYTSGVIVDISPAAPLVEVQHTVRSVIREVRGDRACTWRQSKPHISLGYAYDTTDSDPWQNNLRQIDPNHVPLRIAELELVDVRPDTVSKQLEWTAIAPTMLLAENSTESSN